MYEGNRIWIGSAGQERIHIEPRMANRHGLIAGATGTGKTVTLKVLAESFSDAGVPVFLADVKGDLSGMIRSGEETENARKRIEALGLSEAGFSFHSYPSVFWDVYGEHGIPVRTTITEMGPVLLSKLMDLNATQSDILTIAFRIADEENLELIDSKDLKALLQYMYENNVDLSMHYGNISKQSINTIVRHVVALEAEGGEQFFSEPGLDLKDWFSVDAGGKGTIHILDSRKLINSPTLYSVFLLWMLSELFEILPEVGDPEKPRMVFFFDEAHLLFKNIPKALEEKLEQTIKLIRSKGVGIYFITQSPRDIPDAVLAQLGNKIQHALHAYTPAEKKAIRAVAQSYRENPAFDTETVLQELGVGEALVSVLDSAGTPTIVQRAKILLPQSYMGGISEEEREREVKLHHLSLKYQEAVDPESAYEKLMARKSRMEEETAAAQATAAEEKLRAKEEAAAARAEAKAQAEAEKKAAQQRAKTERAVKTGVSSVARTAGGTIGREMGNAVGSAVGGKFGKKLAGNLGASLGRNILGTLFKL